MDKLTILDSGMCTNSCPDDDGPLSHYVFVAQEISQFQNRLNQAMTECQYQAQDMMKPGYENDAKAMTKVEDSLLSCMEKTVNEYIGKLKPLEQRVADQMKSL